MVKGVLFMSQCGLIVYVSRFLWNENVAGKPECNMPMAGEELSGNKWGIVSG